MKSARPVALFRGIATAEMEAAALAVLRSGQIASGPKVAEFEAQLSHIVGRAHLACTSDMTAAILMALSIAGVGPGDEVATLAYSCMSSNSPIAKLGATPVWVDIDAASASMSLRSLEAAISPRTKAVMLYHAVGYPGPAAEIAELCRRHGIPLIEDCNNALGATIDGARVGTHGEFAVYSFYPNRQVNALEGGAIACPDEASLQRARRLRRFGIDLPNFRDALGEISPSADIPEVGISASLSQLNAAVGLTQLPGLNDRLAASRRHHERLVAGLAGVPGLTPVWPRDGAQPTYWAALMLCEQRDRLLGALKSAGIHASKLHHRNDDYSGFAAPRRPLPGTDDFMARIVALPCGWWLTEEDLDRVIAEVRACLR